MTQRPTKRSEDQVHEVVRARYAEIARAGRAVPQACCGGPDIATVANRLGYTPEQIRAVPEGANLGVGCGAPLAAAALGRGETVLDLGAGAGFDAFVAAREVGPTGRVIGVDMTPEMIERARHNAAAAGYDNVEFRQGRIEALPVDDDSVDLVISNCVINLVPDKAAVYREVARVLRPGGRMVVSDIVLDSPLPDVIAGSLAALTGCVAGATLRADYLDTIAGAGLVDVEIVSDRSFGSLALDMVPPELIAQARAAGIEVEAVAETVRALTVRARKPAAARCGAPACPAPGSVPQVSPFDKLRASGKVQ